MEQREGKNLHFLLLSLSPLPPFFLFLVVSFSPLSETELWAREDWQKVSSSLSHDAFIRRSSSHSSTFADDCLSHFLLLMSTVAFQSRAVLPSPPLSLPQSRIFSASIVYSIAKTLGEVGSLHRCHTFESSEITFFLFFALYTISFDRYNHVYVMHTHACIFIFVTVSRKRRKQDKKESGLKIERKLETILRTRSLQVAEVTWSTLLVDKIEY